MRVEHAHIAVQFLVAPRLVRLTLHGADLALHLCEDVRHAQQIGLRVFQFAERLLLLRLTLGNAGSFFKNLAPILRLGGEQHVNFPLLHDAVGAAAHTRVHEQLVDVLEPAGVAVDLILALPVAENAAGDADFVELQAEALAVVERQADLRHAVRLALVRAVENHVRHFPTAQGLGRGLAQRPAHRVHDVGFPAAVRAHDGRHALMEVNTGLVSERFEAVQVEGFQAHS